MNALGRDVAVGAFVGSMTLVVGLHKKRVGVDIPILQVKIGLNFGTSKAELMNDG